MRFKEITLTRGGTVNQGNFNNIRFDVSATVTLTDVDGEEEAYARLRDWVHKKAKEESKG